MRLGLWRDAHVRGSLLYVRELADGFPELGITGVALSAPLLCVSHLGTALLQPPLLGPHLWRRGAAVAAAPVRGPIPRVEMDEHVVE